MSATYAIYTSPSHQPIPDHLPTLIITPHGKPHQVLYTYLHTNYNRENYLLTPSDQGDLCVAKLFPPPRNKPKSTSSGHGQHNPTNTSSSERHPIRCEASRNLRWSIRNEGIQNPIYKLTLPNPDNPQIEQPLFQVSKPNPNCPWWTLFYFTYAGHLIPPKRVEFGKIMKSQSNDPRGGSGETKISVTGQSEEEKAVWKTLGDGNEDMVEWILICAAMTILDDEITKAVEAAGVKLSTGQPRPTPPQSAPVRQLHPTGNAQRPPAAAPIRPAVYNTPPGRQAPPPPHPAPYRPPHPDPRSTRSASPLPPGAGPLPHGAGPLPPGAGRPYGAAPPQSAPYGAHPPQSASIPHPQRSHTTSTSSRGSHARPITPPPPHGPGGRNSHESSELPYSMPHGSMPTGHPKAHRPIPGSPHRPLNGARPSPGSPHGSTNGPRPMPGSPRAPPPNHSRPVPGSPRGPPLSHARPIPGPVMAHAGPRPGLRAMAQGVPNAQHSPGAGQSPLRSANSTGGRAPIQVPYEQTGPLRVRKVR